ncbi:MAG: polysaccharide biosynthesis/export family protein [Paracoccaceae bacterium]|nr:polysaccharide biosynthesis/export family protein [Paracoccaceae bacterium]
MAYRYNDSNLIGCPKMFRTLFGLVLALIIVPAAWAQSSYRIQPGDLLQMEVLEDPSLNRSLLVLPDGSVSLPLVGSVKASGKSIDGLRSAISSSLASNFASAPTVYLSVGQLNATTSAVDNAFAQAAAARVTGTISIYALGEVTNQGAIAVEPGITLLQFLSASGGLTQFAATKRIQLRRHNHKTGQETVYHYNFKAVQNGASAPMIVLQAGDVIVVPERKLFE